MYKCFRCRYCGNDFYLSNEDYELYIEGYFDHEPDTCPECENNFSGDFEYELFSDAETGL